MKKYIAVLAVAGLALTGCSSPNVATKQSSTASKTTAPAAPAVVETKSALATTDPVETTAPAEPSLTAGQKKAIGSAESYLAFAAFSRKGLIHQLSSDAGEGFSVADATYAADHVTVNWNDQAAKAAKAYLEMTHFSRKGLIHQLESSAGDSYTHAQAVYGVTKAGL